MHHIINEVRDLKTQFHSLKDQVRELRQDINTRDRMFYKSSEVATI